MVDFANFGDFADREELMAALAELVASERARPKNVDGLAAVGKKRIPSVFLPVFASIGVIQSLTATDLKVRIRWS